LPARATEASVESQVVVAEIKDEADELCELGFFSPLGYLISTGYCFGADERLPITWTREGHRNHAEARLVRRDATSSVALLEVIGAEPPQPTLPTRNSTTLPTGATVMVEGTQGRVIKMDATVSLLGIGTPVPHLLITTDVSNVGDAGAPVTDEKGSVVAMVMGGSDDQATFSVPIETNKESFPETFPAT
jgi:S1-C subfamily serine protease